MRTENRSYSLLKEKLCARVHVYACVLVCAHASMCYDVGRVVGQRTTSGIGSLFLPRGSWDGTQLSGLLASAHTLRAILPSSLSPTLPFMVPEIRLRTLSRLGKCPIIELHCQQHCFPANWKTLTIILITDASISQLRGHNVRLVKQEEHGLAYQS